MSKDTKVMIGVVIFTFVLIVGFAFWQGGKADLSDNDSQVLSQIADIQLNPENYDLGEIPINGGIVTKEYELKNDSSAVMKIQKIVTSCMCTQAMVSTEDRNTRFFGMEHPGDRNPPVNFEINSGETAKVTVNFDPAAHGPQGIGPFDRVVTLTFSEPAGVKSLTFKGTVISN